MMLFLLNIMLAVLWCFTWGSFSFYTLITGFVLGYMVLGLYSRAGAMESYGRKARDLARFSLYFLRILISANLQIAWEILTPPHRVSPRIVRLDVTGMTAVQRTILANMINLTPGTLVVDISEEKETFYVHCMYARDRDAALQSLKDLKQRLLTEVLE